MLFLRHGDVTPDEFGIDLLRELSEKGRKQAEEVKFPTKYSAIFVSPAVRAMQTAEIATKMPLLDVVPILYAPILLPEMDVMYAEHGQNVRAYINDERITNTLKLTEKAADTLKRLGCTSKSLVVAHGLILNLIAYYIYADQKILDINLETAKGFWINDMREIIEF